MLQRSSGLTIATQNVNDLMTDHVLHSLTGGLQVLSGVEVIRMFSEVLADAGGHGKTDIGVDIDLADSTAGSLTELFFGDADGTGHISAEFIDHLNIFLGNT